MAITLGPLFPQKYDLSIGAKEEDMYIMHAFGAKMVSSADTSKVARVAQW